MAFPYTIGVVDDFNRANGAIGASWGSWPSAFYNTSLTIDTNAARGVAGQENSNRWLTSYGPNMGAYLTFFSNPASFGGIFIRADGTTDSDGYQLIYLVSGNVFRIDVGGTTIASTTQVLAPGSSIGIEAVGTTIKAHYNDNAGGGWVNLLTVTDTTLSTGGYAGMFGDSNSTWYDSFAAGAISAGSPPANTVAPVVSGSTVQGATLTTDNGTWTNSPTGYTYQWQRDNSGGGTFSNIVGETNNFHNTVVADVGSQVRCVVTATNASGSASANSNALTITANPGGSFNPALFGARRRRR